MAHLQEERKLLEKQLDKEKGNGEKRNQGI